MAELPAHYQALVPLIDDLKGAVFRVDQAQEQPAELRRRGGYLLDLTRAVLHEDSLVVPEVQMRIIAAETQPA